MMPGALCIKPHLEKKKIFFKPFLNQFCQCSEPAVISDYVPSVQFTWACDM